MGVFSRLFKKSSPPTHRSQTVTWTKRSELPVQPFSKPQDVNHVFLPESDKGSIVPPGIDPSILFPLLRKLRDTVPDVSAGVWAWVRLCSTQQSLSVHGGTEARQEEAHSILSELNRRILVTLHEREQGIEALLQSFFLSVFTYGAFCGEIVLQADRRGIDRFIIVDPATIRFKLDTRSQELLPYQLQMDGSLTALNPSSFFYYALDTDGLSPYGRSPLSTLPMVVKIQQQLLMDMARAQHNAGYPSIHFCLTKPDRIPGENTNRYFERMKSDLLRVRDEIESRAADSNLVTYDNVEVRYIGPTGQAYQWSESMQAVSEQVISALHLAPFMIGRNWGTTESWGTAQYHLLTNNARSVQEAAKRLAEWLRNLELILKDSPCRVTHHFAPHHHLDATDRADAFKTSSQTLLELMEKGILDKGSVRQHVEVMLKDI